MARARPLIGVTADRKMIDGQPHYAMGEKYVRAVLEAATAVPLLIPPLAEELGLEELLERVDGLVFTGSPSNVEPHHYGGPPAYPAHCTIRHAMRPPCP